MQLASGGGLAQLAAPPAPHGGGLAEALPQLLSILGDHGVPGGVISSIVGNFGSVLQQHQAQQQQNRQGFASLAGNYASQPGATPDMLNALASTSYPNIAASQYGQSALGSLSAALPTATTDTTVAPEDIAAIQANVAKLVADGQSTLNDAIVQTTQAARLAGAPEEVIDKMKTYITSLWARAKGWETMDQSPPPSYSGDQSQSQSQPMIAPAPSPSGLPPSVTQRSTNLYQDPMNAGLSGLLRK